MNARTPSLASSSRISVEMDLGFAGTDRSAVEVERIPQQPLAGRHRRGCCVLRDVVGQLVRGGQHVVGVEHATAQAERHRPVAVESARRSNRISAALDSPTRRGRTQCE